MEIVYDVKASRYGLASITFYLPHSILFKIVQASRKILEAVDLFVALATVKLKSLISKNAVQLGGKRVGARETRSVSSGDSKDLAGFPGRHTGLESAGQKHVVR